MHLPAEGEVLRVFIGESDRYGHRPLYEAIVNEARKRRMAGATVLRGMLGFGAHSRVHTAKILCLSQDLPIVVEIVDTPERIAGLLPVIDGMMREGLITIEKVHVLAYRHDGGTSLHSHSRQIRLVRVPGEHSGRPLAWKSSTCQVPLFPAGPHPVDRCDGGVPSAAAAGYCTAMAKQEESAVRKGQEPEGRSRR